MAELYLCTAVGPEGFEKEVVIKRIKEFLSNDQSFIEMFKAEARLASRLNHANVVQIFDFDKHVDAWFIAMEYVYGASLWELRRRCRELAMPFPPILVAEIGAQVARGLHYAHTLSDKGKPLALVHRDVTPHNVLMSFDGGVKLADFGIAKAGTSFTAPGMLKGKFAYMSPEQARGEKVDARTDVFALGITLWEMLTGGRLFEGDSDIAVLRAVQESLIAPPARLNPDVPTELSEVVLKALARPLDERFQSAQELERALAHFVLKNSASTDDANVGLFLRQMFRDELEAAERELSVAHLTGSSDASQTPVVDAYAFGNTRHVVRNHHPQTQQTATPIPAAGVTASERPHTAVMPGVRPSKPLPPLMDEDDSTRLRTDQMSPLEEGQPRAQTAQMPGLRSSRRLPGVVDEPPMHTDVAPAIRPGPVSSDVAIELPRKTMLPWVVTAFLAIGIIAGLGFAVQQARPSVPPPPTVVELPDPPAAPKPVAEPEPEPEPEPRPAEVAAVLAAPSEIAAEAPAPTVEKVQEPAPAAAPATADAPAGETRPAAEAAKPKGVLIVDAIPFGALFLNNKKFADIEGLRRISLVAGTYTVRFEHPKKRTRDEPVTIKAGQSASIQFRPLVP